MRLASTFAGLALTALAGVPAAAAPAASAPEAAVAEPVDTDRARGYWDSGRMARASEVLPVVLDPDTRQPVRER